MRLDAFRGTWTIVRSLDDIRQARLGAFTGTATFEPVPEGPAYREEGRLTLGGAGH